MAKTYSKLNESTDVTIQPELQSKILAYAAKRIKDSGAVVLADIKDIITFNDPLDGMISFSYLDTLAEDDELSEDGGYQYIEDAVSDIADYIQQQGYTLDPDSDDPLIFVDDRYDDADVDIEESSMNESVNWNETDEPNQWVNKLTKNKVAIDPITLECKDLGVAVLASKLSEDNNFYKVMVVATDTGKSMTKTMPFDGIDLESAISKLKKCDNRDDLYTTISKYLFLRQSDVSKLFSTSMNEAASITKTDNYDEFNLLPPGNKFMDPIKLENKELGILATAGVMFYEDDPDNEDDYAAAVLISPLDSKYENYIVAGIFDDNYSAAKNIMKKLAQIKTPDELAKIVKDKKFSDYYGIKSNTDFLVDMVRKLYSKMNESTVMNESVSIKKSDRYREFDLLPKGKGWVDPVELTNKDAGFYAIAGTAYDSTDRSNQDEWGVVLYLVPLDKKYEDIVICGSFYDYEESAYYLMDKLAKAKTPQDVARIIKNQEFTDDYGDDETEFIGALTKSYSTQNESTRSMNESVKIESLNPKDYGLSIDKVYPDGTNPLMVDNSKLGFIAIAYRSNPNKEEYSLEVITDGGDNTISEKSNWSKSDALKALRLLGNSQSLKDFGVARYRYKFSNQALTFSNNLKIDEDGYRVTKYKDVTSKTPTSSEDYYNFLDDGRVVKYLSTDFSIPSNVKLEGNTNVLDKVIQSLPQKDSKNKANMYDIDKVPWTTYNVDGVDRVACLGETDKDGYKALVIIIANGKNLKDLSNSKKKVLVTNNKINDDNLQYVINLLSKVAKSDTSTKEVFALRSIINEDNMSKLEKLNEATYVMNESAKIKPCDPELEGFDLLDSNNPLDFEPVDLENEELGFYAIAGVATGMGGDFDEDDCSIEICVTALDPEAADEVLVAEYYDVDYKAMAVMQELAKATTFPELASILHKEGFQGMNGDYSDFVEDLTKLNEMNEYTEVPDGRMTVELDDEDVIESDTHLLAELTDEVFQAINTVMDELDPDADLQVIEDTEDKLVIEVVSDEDLDDDAFDEVLSELLEDIDLENIVADMTDSVPITDPADEDFGRVVQYINFYEINGDTVTPSGATMEDNLGYIEDEDVINESFNLNTDLTKFLKKLADEFKKEFKSNPDVDGTSFSFEKKGKDKVFIQAIADSVNPGSRALSNYLRFLDENGVEYKTLQEFEYYKGALNCTIYTTIKITDIKSEEVMNESYKFMTNLTKLVDKLSDEFFADDKNVIFLSVENEEGNIELQVSTLDKNLSRKRLTGFMAFLAKKNVEFDVVNNVKVDSNTVFFNARSTIHIMSEKGSQVQYRNELNESTNASDTSRIRNYVDDLNFKAGVKFVEDEGTINKVLKAINSKLSVDDYRLDKLPWVTYKTEEGDKVAVFFKSPIMPYKMSIAIGDGKNLSDFVSNSKSILVFNNLKKLDDWNNINIIVRIMNNLAKVTDRASEYKAIKSLLSNYEKQVYNYAKYDESFDPMYESYYKDTDEDLSIDQAKINKALKAIDRILTKAGYPLDNLDKVYRFNYPRPGLVEINLINTLNSTYGFMGNKAYDIDTKIERKLESLNLTYASKDKSGKEIYTDDDKLVHYMSNELDKYIKTGKVPDREWSRNMVSAVHPKLEDIAKDITKYIESHPKYKKFNLYEYPPVHAGADWIKVKVETEDIQDGKDILIDTDKYIAKNHKDLYHRVASKSSVKDKKYPFIEYSTAYTPKPGEGTLMWSNYEMRGSSIKDLMNESTKFTPKLPTQKELQAIIQKSLMKVGDRSTRVTVHAIDDGFVDIDLTNTPLATDGRDEDYYNEDDIRNSLDYALKELINKFYQPRDLLDVMRVSYNKVGSLTITLELDSEFNESTKFDFDNLEEVLEEDLDSAIDLPDYADGILVYCYPTGQGYGVKVTLDERLVGDNKLHIIDRITKVVIDRCGKDYDLDQKRNRSKGEYYLTYSYKGSPFNECTLYPSTPDNPDYNQSRKDSLAKAMVTDQPLVDEYDIRCTIRPVFIRKGQYLYDGRSVMRSTSDAKFDKESGLYNINVDILLSNEEDLTEPTTTISYSAEFNGLKLLKSNPVKPYNESTDPKKVDTVNMSFSNEDDAKEFIKDNGIDQVKSYQGKFGWVVEVKKSELKVK